ncbi:helix-turn-helix domain-containing protein, partial [Parafrankia sp. FMc2]|uniref:helix-turn-helix domain-containing protein n=1 Tax=Parafrankia sp. FMc2 TaxID=3233196 RepID=UPI0034D6537E
MSRFRLSPDAAQAEALLAQCGYARFVWNLGQEQRAAYRAGRGPAPGYHEQARQLTEARRTFGWLAAGSQTVQQQALRDLDQAWRNFFAGTHRRPGFRRQGVHEGFRIVGQAAGRVRVESRRWSSVLVPKVGWVRFRRSRPVPAAKSYRVTQDRTDRWHISFAVVPEPIEAPGTGAVVGVGVDRGVAVSVTLSTGELRVCPGLRSKEAGRVGRLQRRQAKA